MENLKTAQHKIESNGKLKKMEYLTIYRTFFFPTFLKMEEATAAKTKRTTELKDWTDALNDYAKVGFRVLNCGTFVPNHEGSEQITFWALLEKPAINP
jgi:hypothetical protein